jgi:hypothetical protein
MSKKEANDLKIAIKSCFTTLVEDTTLIQNAATPYPVEFAFSKDWDGFAKTALFEAGGVSMAVVLSEDKCDIPGECLKKGGIRNVYDSYGVSADNVTTSGQMTFRCDTTPTVDLSVFIIRLEVGTDE